MKRFIIFTVCTLCMVFQSAYAETLLRFDTASRTVSISGNVESDRVKSFVSFAVIPYGMDAKSAQIQNNTLDNVFYKTAQTDEDGNFITEFSLPYSMENGQYSIISTGENINRFGLVNDDFLQDLSLINSANTIPEMSEVLNSLTTYNIDNQTIVDFGDNISAYLCNSKPVNGYSKESFVKAYNTGEGLARLSVGNISLGELLCEYSAYTDVNYTDTYGSLSANGKAEAEELFKKEISLIKGNFPEVYQRAFEIAKIKDSETADKLKTNYLKSAKERNRSLSEYNSLGYYEQESVFLTMHSLIGPKKSLSEIDALFDECVREQKPSTSVTNPTYSGGGGGGGGGSSVANKGSAAINNSIPVASAGNATTEQKALFDIKGHWAEGYIRDLYEKGVVNGYDDGSFCPDNVVTRAEFVKIICKMFNLSGGGKCYFNDVSSDDWFYDTVCTAEKYGLITGDDNGSFAPYKLITREDAAVILQRFLRLDTASEVSFEDFEQISDYAADAVKVMVGAGVMNGYDDNTIKPKGEITRAEAVAVIFRAAELE